MTSSSVLRERGGLEFFLPDVIEDKDVSVIEVGVYEEAGLAEEVNMFLGTSIADLNRINAYILIHPKGLQGLESLLTGKPFVDPIVQRATLNQSLALQLNLPFDYVLQSMLRPGTSDAEGNVALQQALLSLGIEQSEGDLGFFSKQYFLCGDLTGAQLEEVSAFLANPDLNSRLILPRAEYKERFRVQVPVVMLKPEVKVERFDVVNMSDEELLKMNSERRLAATLEELRLFSDMYKDEEFIRKRRAVGLGREATDVEIETWFGLRSEHCFHKEMNAHITLEDLADDPIFKRAFEKGLLQRVGTNGPYVLEKGIFPTFIKAPAQRVFEKLEKRGKNWIVSMFEDNSGVVLYNEKYMFCIKWETHNSPSNKEPVQGAKTGIDGVNRDIFGTMLGTFEAIANFFFYSTGNPHYKGWLPKGVKHPYVILKGITQGVREGGNESQIPTLGGGLITDPRFIAKCLVYCGTVGFSPVASPEGISYIGKHPSVGDIVFVAGHAVGVDGVHGATESSLIAGEHISLGHVQADFSFCQAKLKDYSLECARDVLFSDIGDCGAMGIASLYEMARATRGIICDLEKHPKKYAGIQQWQIGCSETQDRMVPAANPKNRDEILRRAKLHEVDVTELGELTDSGFVHLTYGNETVAYIDIEKLFDKEPRKKMHATWSGAEEKPVGKITRTYSLEDSLCLVMSQPDVASKEWFFRQKDSSVKGGTILGPLIGLEQEVESDATIQKPLETEGEDYGAIAYAVGINPKVSDIDPYYAAQKSFVDMIGKIIAVGGALPDMENAKWDAWAVCGNYCQPNSDSNDTLTRESGEHNLASIVREGLAVAEVTDALNIPVISGKDSMKCSCVYEVDDSFKLEEVPLDLRRHVILSEKNGKRHIEIHDPDSYLSSCAVKIDDYRKCVNSAFKVEGDLIYVIGTTRSQMGASQYLSAVGYNEQGAPIEGGEAPKAELEEFKDIATAVHNAIDHELVASCSYIHNGGLAAALAKAALAGEKGAEIRVADVKGEWELESEEELLYSETPGRFVVTIAPRDKQEFEKALGSVDYRLIGEVSCNNLLTVERIDATRKGISLEKVKAAYQKPLDFGLHDLVS